MASAIDTEDAINKDLGQLHAMLIAIYGGGIDHFASMSKELQDAYLWACTEKVEQVQASWNRYRGSPGAARRQPWLAPNSIQPNEGGQ